MFSIKHPSHFYLVFTHCFENKIGLCITLALKAQFGVNSAINFCFFYREFP